MLTRIFLRFNLQQMEASRQKREQEEQVNIALAKQAALDDFTDVMENELQCSICSELFIQVRWTEEMLGEITFLIC